MNTQGLIKRPTGITITAWLWIATGGLMIFSGVMAGFAYAVAGLMGQPPTEPADIPSELMLMNIIFRYFGVFVVVQLIVAALALWSGIGLLKLKAWARTAIEALSWLALVYCLAFGVFWVYTWVSVAGQVPPSAGAPVDLDAFQFMGAIMGLVVTAMFTVPLWFMIRYLRGAEARAATQSPG